MMQDCVFEEQIALQFLKLCSQTFFIELFYLYFTNPVLSFSKLVSLQKSREPLNFYFGIGVQPEGPNRGACERITDEVGTLRTEFHTKM